MPIEISLHVQLSIV